MPPTSNGAAYCSSTLGELDTTRACAVWGTARKLSAPHAALVNGTQVQGFELDDVHRSACCTWCGGAAAR